MLKKFFTFSRFTLFVALCISAIAAYYSVVGLTAIFAGAIIPIIVMGTILEVAKITTTVWLHKYWDRASWSIKTYLTSAVIALALLTSMGIFGLLSKAHSDTGLVSGDVVAQLNLIDEKIKIQRDNVDAARKALQQMDDQVNQRLARSDNEQGAERAVQIRRQQSSERGKLLKEINDAQVVIAKLNEERAPIAAKSRKVEAEVGPIKYIASLIYGDNPDSNLLERAVRWVTILIVIVFDPLAIILILAANNSLKWEREDVQSDIPDIERKKEIEPENSKPSEPIPNQVVNEQTSLDETIKEELSDVPVEENVDFRQGKYQENYSFRQPEITLHSDENVYNDVVSVFDPKTVENTTPWPSIWDEEPDESNKKDTEIITENVTKEATISSVNNDYVTYNGKKTSLDALRSMNLVPDLSDLNKNEILYGSEFPKVARAGDVYTRVDVMPHRTFKFNGTRWIQINRQENSSYLQNTSYLQFLISKLENGEYDAELLTETEQDEISEYLKKTT